MNLPLNWSDVIGRDLPEQPPITEEIRQQTIRESKRFRGSVRLSIGRFWTEEEYSQWRNKVMNTPLP
jgi:hypothetical protein